MIEKISLKTCHGCNCLNRWRTSFGEIVYDCQQNDRVVLFVIRKENNIVESYDMSIHPNFKCINQQEKINA